MSEIVQVNGKEEEKRFIPKGEKEIIGRLNCPTKFTRKDFDLETKLGMRVSCGKDNRVAREKVVDLDFRGSKDWLLAPAYSRALYSSKESTAHLIDDAQRRRILSRCPTLSGKDTSHIHMTAVHERLSVPSDMRHIFMKMYLMLQDYNLGVTSKSDKIYTADNIQYQLKAHASAVDRLAVATSHDVVVDGDMFTPEELGLLCLAGEEYPSVWYGRENMYSKCHMEADDVYVISASDINIDTSMLWGSPDQMYHTMWNIAAKMNSVGCLISALENMRGKCKMAADIFEHVEGNTINSLVPLSYNLQLSFGGDQSKMAVANMPGYLSSSMALVSDLLYGASFQAVATCVAEALGACGTLISSKTPRTNKVINGIMRDYGLQHTSAEDNILLQNWEIVAGRPITWEFGVLLKEYVIGLSEMIVNGVDIKMPQLLMTIPSLTAVNTAFGLARGWKGPKHILETDKVGRANDSDGLASLAWLLGVRDVRPAVFFNRSSKKPNLTTYKEGNLQAELDGYSGVGTVGFWLHDTVGGRTDESEETASMIYSTEYAGTNCSLVYSYAQEQWVTQIRPQEPSRMTLSGKQGPSAPLDVRTEEEEVRVPLAAPKETGEEPDRMKTHFSGVNWGGVKKSKPEDVLKHLKTLSKVNQIAPSAKPRHARVDSSSHLPIVGEYLVGNEERNTLRRYQKPHLAVGDTIKYGTLQVPGDGSCGIHAIVEDMRTHGLMAPDTASKTFELFSRESMSSTFHDGQELAALCIKWGMGMDLIDVDAGRVMQFGERRDDAHVVTIAREGTHFSPAVLGTGDRQLTIKQIYPVETTDEEYVKRIEEFGRLFGDVEV